MRRISGSVLWSLIGQAWWAAGQWIQSSAASHLGGEAELGRLGLAMAISSPVMLLASLQLRAIQASDSAGRFPFPACLALRAVTTAAGLTIILVLAAVGWWWSVEARWALAAIGLWRAVDLLADVFHGRMQQHEDLRSVGIGQTLRTIAGSTVFIALLAAHADLAYAAVGGAVASGTVLASYEIPRLRGLGHAVHAHWSRATLGTLARAGVPLGMAMMLSSLLYAMPRYVLERCQGEAAVGVFTALTCFLVIPSTIINGIGQAVLPRLSRFHHEGRTREFRRWSLLVLAAGAALGLLGSLVALAAGGPLLGLFFGTSFSVHAPLLTLTMITSAAWCAATALGFAATASQRHRGQPAALGATLAAVSTACLVLIPANGILGAVMAMGVGGIANLASFGFLMRRRPDGQVAAARAMA
jgi:O-antigen/teichoic acid export membrane protein